MTMDLSELVNKGRGDALCCSYFVKVLGDLTSSYVEVLGFELLPFSKCDASLFLFVLDHFTCLHFRYVVSCDEELALRRCTNVVPSWCPPGLMCTEGHEPGPLMSNPPSPPPRLREKILSSEICCFHAQNVSSFVVVMELGTHADCGSYRLTRSMRALSKDCRAPPPSEKKMDPLECVLTVRCKMCLVRGVVEACDFCRMWQQSLTPYPPVYKTHLFVLKISTKTKGASCIYGCEISLILLQPEIQCKSWGASEPWVRLTQG